MGARPTGGQANWIGNRQPVRGKSRLWAVEKRETAMQDKRGNGGGDRRTWMERRADDKADLGESQGLPASWAGLRTRSAIGVALAAALPALAARYVGADAAVAAGFAGACVGMAFWWRGVSRLGEACSQLEAFARSGGPLPPAPRNGSTWESAIYAMTIKRLIRRLHAHAGEKKDREIVDERIGKTLQLMDAMPDPVFWVGANGTVTWANASARGCGLVMDKPAPEWLGDPFEAGVIEVAFKEGKDSTHYEFAKREIGDGDRRSAAAAVIGRDVSERRRREEAEKLKSITCNLTGILNRGGFNMEIDRLRGSGENFALIYIDLDKFKPVNDTYGHPAGDALLIEVAKLLKKLPGSSFRLGGDEFAMVIPGADRTATDKVAREIVRLCNVPFDLKPKGGDAVTVQIGASVGCACLPEHASTAETLLTAADEAMYECKRRGRNQHAFPD